MRDQAPLRSDRTSGARSGLLFIISLAAGILLASTVIEQGRSWWSDAPVAVESIAVLGNDRVSIEGVAAATEISRGEPLRGLSVSDIERRVAQHPFVRSARAALLPTGTLVIEVEEHTVRAVLRTPDPNLDVTYTTAHFDPTTRTGNGGAIHLIDDTCTPFARVTRAQAEEFSALPQLALESAIDRRTATPAPLRTALPASRPVSLPTSAELCEAVSLGEAIQQIHSTNALAAMELVLPESGTDRGFVLHTRGGHEVLLGNSNDAKRLERVSNLGRLLSANLIQLDEASTIDLRFAGQAVLRSLRASR